VGFEMRYYSLILLFAWALCPAILMAQSYENSVAGDHKALMDIYHATNGDNWYNNDGWGGAPETMGNWWGVATDSNGRVIHLDLQTGTKSITSSNSIPNEYGNNLNNAELINGEWELIPGRELPESIGNLTKLRYLNLKHNTLRGPLPNGITNLVSAKRILLAGHPREPQYGSGTSAPGNHPTATGIPSSEGVSKAAQALNFFEGSIPSGVGQLQNLEIFELAFSGVSGSIPFGFGDLKELRMLLLHRNSLTGPLPSNIGNANKLRYLYLFGNGLSGEIPPEIGNLSDMKHLRLNSNNFTGVIPEELGNISNLRFISLSRNSYSPQPFPEFLLPREGHNQSLDGILFGNMNLIGELPQDYDPSYIDENRFNVFEVDDNNLTGPVPNWISQHNFIIVNMTNNAFSGDLPAGFFNNNSKIYNRLRNLYLHRNKLTGPLPSVDFGPDIRNVFLYENNFSGGIPAEWGNIAGSARGTKLNIRVHRNRLSGRIPVNVAGLEVTSGGELGEFDISENRFRLSDIEPFKTELLKNHPGVDFSYGGQNPAADDGDGNDNSNTTPKTPILKSPANGGQKISLIPTFEWNSVESDHYEIRIYSENSSGAVIQAEIQGTSFTPQNELDAETLYSWRVRAVKDGNRGDWSSRWELITRSVENSDDGSRDDSKPKTPKMISPSNDSKNIELRPRFEWEAVDADYFIIRINTENSSSPIILSEVNGTTFTPEKDLTPETIHDWRVRAVKDGKKGEWSSRWTFSTGKNKVQETLFETELSQNYPNPFNPTTQIRFTIPEAQQVSLKVYDMAGRLVANLVDNTSYSAGSYEVTFNANSLASGIYFYRFITESEIVTRKMTLMK